MTYQSVIKKMVGPTRTLVLHTATLQLCLGSKSPYETTAFLERIIYFQSLKLDDDQWVYDTRETLMRELYFAERQLRNAITFLQDELQILQTQRRLITYQGKPATVTHFLVDMERLEFFLLHPEEVPSVKLTDPDIALLEEAQGPVGQIDRRGYDSLTDPASSDLTDAYKGTQSQTQSLTQSLIPPLPSVVSGGGEETQTPPVRKLRRKKSDLVPAPVLPMGDGLDGGGSERAVPETEPPLTRRVPPARPANPMFDALAPIVSGSTSPAAQKAAASHIAKVGKLLTAAEIAPEEVPALTAYIQTRMVTKQSSLKSGTFEKYLSDYMGVRDGTATPTATSALAARYLAISAQAEETQREVEPKAKVASKELPEIEEALW